MDIIFHYQDIVDRMITTKKISDMPYLSYQIFDYNKLTPFRETKRQQVTICILEHI